MNYKLTPLSNFASPCEEKGNTTPSRKKACILDRNKSLEQKGLILFMIQKLCFQVEKLK